MTKLNIANTKLKYHPFRYVENMKDVLSRVAEDFYSEDYEEFHNENAGLMFATLFESRVEHILNHYNVPNRERLIEWRSFNFNAVDRFKRSGENIFHIQETLRDMFFQTDVSEVDLEGLKLPYSYNYIYWGKSSKLSFTDSEYGFDYYIDGAYVDVDVISEREITFTINFTTTTEPLDEAITNPHEFLIKDKSFHLMLYTDRFEQRTKLGDCLPDGIKEIEDVYGSESPSEELRKNAINLLFNILVFIGSQHNDAVEDFMEGTPKSFGFKYKNASSKKQKERIESKAKSQGFSRIKFLGRSISESHISSNSGVHVSAHWRRGHWRNQPYGLKTEAKTKPIWIKPTIVNKDLDTEKPMNGHVYEV